jgi:hypothetical protein
MIPAMCVPWPNVSLIGKRVGAIADEILREHHPSRERAMPGPDAGVDERDADAAAGHSGTARDPGPCLIGANRHVGDRHERGHLDVAREVIDLGAERLYVGSARLEYGAIRQPLLDRQAPAGRERVDLIGRPMHDDIDLGGRLRRDMFLQAFGKSGARLRPERCARQKSGGNSQG